MSRYWGQNIKIYGDWLLGANNRYTEWLGSDATTWEADVQSVFRKIESSATGKVLIGLINAVTSKKLSVIPIGAANFSQTAARPEDWTPAMKKGHRFECPEGDRCSQTPTRTGIAPHSKLLRGTGEGVDVRLYYHPAGWTAHRQLRAADVAAGIDTLEDNMQPDDVLFHELVHAYRYMKGMFEYVSTGDAWHATEEFYAIVLANIYVSETRPRGTLRGDHSAQFHSLQEAGRADPTDTTGITFYTKNMSLVDQMIREMPELCNPLKETSAAKRIPAVWNPLRCSQQIDDGRRSGMWDDSSATRWADLMSRP